MENTELVIKQLAGIKIDAKGHRVVALTDLPNLLPEVRLILLFDHSDQEHSLTDQAVDKVLVKEFYDDIHPTQGGLSWDSYNKLARNCPPLAEAANSPAKPCAGPPSSACRI